MLDAWLVAARVAEYFGLMAAFGLPLFTWNALLREHTGASITRRLLRWSGVASAFSLIASVFGLWAMAHGMAGEGSDAWAITRILLVQTTAGLTWIVRVFVLASALVLAATLRVPVHVRVAGMTMLGAGAVATLAWAGHGATSTGNAAWLHVTADIAHLLAAGAWFGALVALVFIARHATGGADAASVRLLESAASGFMRLGSVAVITLLASGIANYLFVVGPSLSGLVATLYGRLLLLKLGLFIAMLGLAAANRFRFAPALARAMRDGDAVTAVSTLRRSLQTEAGLAAGVLVLVAVLGTLDPGG